MKHEELVERVGTIRDYIIAELEDENSDRQYTLEKAMYRLDDLMIESGRESRFDDYDDRVYENWASSPESMR